MAAYFSKCACGGSHGSIVCTNGAKILCYSLRAAHQAVKKLEEIGFVVENELPKLLEEIDASGLPATTPHVPAFYYPTRTELKFAPLEEPPTLDQLVYAVLARTSQPH